MKFRHKQKAAAPVLATFLMILVAITMSIIIFFWSQGFLAQISEATGTGPQLKLEITPSVIPETGESWKFQVYYYQDGQWNPMKNASIIATIKLQNGKEQIKKFTSDESGKANLFHSESSSDIIFQAKSENYTSSNRIILTENYKSNNDLSNITTIFSLISIVKIFESIESAKYYKKSKLWGLLTFLMISIFSIIIYSIMFLYSQSASYGIPNMIIDPVLHFDTLWILLVIYVALFILTLIITVYQKK